MTRTKTTSRRYYYTSQKSFEQSLDVYKPVITPTDNDDSSDQHQKHLPLVVLVVGSAWLGHRSIIYTGTSWWNSSGPIAFAKQGCVTVCIRHRGSFPRLHGPLLLPILSLIAATLVLFPKVLLQEEWQEHETRIVTTIVAVMFGWILLAFGARGAAEYDDMLADVADALCWVQRHKDSELLRKPSSSSSSFREEKKQDNDEQQDTLSQTTVVFGGYSSGGHVAATLLQRPELFAAKGLPAPDEFCNAALFISGVLAVRPPISETETPSQWCTDLVTTVVFGTAGAAKLPSPLHQIHKQPKVPHLLIGCENEVFGLKWMDIFFCSSAFVESLQKRKVTARLREVNSDHWNILGSTSLSNVLSEELEWIMKKALE